MRQLLNTIITEYEVPLEEKAAELGSPAAHQVGDHSPDELEREVETRARARELEDPFEAALKAAARRGGAELRLHSADALQNRMADALIQFLVRPGLASVRTQEPAPGTFIYDVAVDWPSLRRVAAAAGINLDEALGQR